MKTTILSHALTALVLVTAPALAAQAPPAPPSEGGSGMGQYFKDEGVTLRVVAKLQFNKQLLREKIDVKTNQGIVTLSGYVSSPDLARLAAQLAGEVSGVTRVVNALQVGAAPPPPAN